MLSPPLWTWHTTPTRFVNRKNDMLTFAHRFGALAATAAGALALAAIAGALTGCGPGETAGSGKKKQEMKFTGPARAVKVAAVEKVSMERVVSAIGSLAALEQSTLSVKVPGRVQTIPIDLGSKVKKGDLIAQIEKQDYDLKLRQSEALLGQARARLGLALGGNDDTVDPDQTSTVKQARAVYEEAAKNKDRVEKLFEKNISSQSDVETARAGYEVAANKVQTAVEDVRDRIAQLAQRRAEVEMARQQLTDATITAPFDGVVQDRKAYVGEYLNVGAPLATLVRTDPLRLRVEVPEREAVGVRAGQKVRLGIEGDPAAYTGTITRLSPAFVEQTRMLLVEADVKNPGNLRPGSFVRSEIVVSENEAAVAVPADALVAFAGVEKVFTIKDNKALEKYVYSGRRAAGFIEVTNQFKPGDQVILNPGNLQNGQPVTMEQSASGSKKAAKAKSAKPEDKGP